MIVIWKWMSWEEKNEIVIATHQQKRNVNRDISHNCWANSTKDTKKNVFMIRYTSGVCVVFFYIFCFLFSAFLDFFFNFFRSLSSSIRSIWRQRQHISHTQGQHSFIREENDKRSPTFSPALGLALHRGYRANAPVDLFLIYIRHSFLAYLFNLFVSVTNTLTNAPNTKHRTPNTLHARTFLFTQEKNIESHVILTILLISLNKKAKNARKREEKKNKLLFFSPVRF